jgi:glutathione synthase/RimK-type ligase-like ATP-grasp enzyme
MALSSLAFGGLSMTQEVNALPASAATGDRMSLNVLFGLPDDQKARIIVAGDGKPLGFDLVGTVGLLPHLPAERFKSYVIYLGPGRTQSVRLGPGPLLNHIGDADICSTALRLAAQVAGGSDRPCFNHPLAVANSTREEVYRLLAGIPGLTVPKTVRIRERDPHEVRTVLQRAGFNYPVLVRIAGSHLGMNLIRVDTADELGAIRTLDRVDHDSLYVTEFHDFVSPDKRYRKFRVVVIGEEIFLRHCIIAESWLIHRNDRASNTEDEERATFARFERDWKSRVQPMFREIGARLGLDYFGVDCNIDETGRVLLFEANPCMNILANTARSPNIWDEPIVRIKDALERRLAAPATWRHFNTRTAA